MSEYQVAIELFKAQVALLRDRVAVHDPRRRGISLEEAALAAGLLAAAILLVGLITIAVKAHASTIQ